MSFSEKLKRICSTEGLNLKEFSELANISYGVIKKYSSGARQPNFPQINKMTEHPRLAPYRNMLLSLEDQGETIGEDPEMMALIRQCEELGIADEAADVIRALLKHAKPK
jgi:transcriptional regulator with XRE-family HTH domain